MSGLKVRLKNEMNKEIKLMKWTVKLPANHFTGFLMISHPPAEGNYQYGWGKSVEVCDYDLLNKLCDYFTSRIEKEQLRKNSEIWDSITSNHSEVINYLMTRDLDNLHIYMKDMFKKPITNGTAQGDRYYNILTENIDDIRQNTAFAIYDKLLCLMEATGLIPAFSPEEFQKKNDFLRFYAVSLDKYIDMLEYNNDECDLSAPKYQGSHFGLQTEQHGLYSDRDIMSLGVAIRIAERYWDRKNISIIDIGTGVGHLPYYLYKLGFKNISVIETPTVAISAMYFLDTNLEDHKIKFISPNDFDGKCDLVINLDGISSYGLESAKYYIDKINKNSKHFLSINREIDAFRVCDLTTLNRVSRVPFWFRRGYVEEDYVRR